VDSTYDAIHKPKKGKELLEIRVFVDETCSQEGLSNLLEALQRAGRNFMRLNKLAFMLRVFVLGMFISKWR
jgi:hypothetical protein